MKSAQDIGSALNSVQAGERLWFWFCPTSNPPLLLSPFRNNDVASLQDAAKTLDVALDAVVCTGVASVSDEGAFCFGSPLIAGEMLGVLAAWVKANLADEPRLARLRDAVFITLRSDGVVVSRHQNPALWEGIPSAVVPGTLKEVLRAISRVRAGADCWLWMTESGPGGQPWMLMRPIRKDPDGALFQERVRALRARSPQGGVMVRGVLRVREAGFSLTTADELPHAQRILTLICNAHPTETERLSGMKLMRFSKGQITNGARLTSASASSASASSALSETARTLEGMSEGADLWFGFSQQGDAAELIISDAQDVVKKYRADPGARQVRGRLRLTAKGWAEFRTRDEYPGFITALAGFVGAHHTTWPALKRLRGARMTQRSPDNTVVDRQRNAQAWDQALGAEQ